MPIRQGSTPNSLASARTNRIARWASIKGVGMRYMDLAMQFALRMIVNDHL
jgi:hypothetical protein